MRQVHPPVSSLSRSIPVPPGCTCTEQIVRMGKLWSTSPPRMVPAHGQPGPTAQGQTHGPPAPATKRQEAGRSSFRKRAPTPTYPCAQGGSLGSGAKARGRKSASEAPACKAAGVCQAPGPRLVRVSGTRLRLQVAQEASRSKVSHARGRGCLKRVQSSRRAPSASRGASSRLATRLGQRHSERLRVARWPAAHVRLRVAPVAPPHAPGLPRATRSNALTPRRVAHWPATHHRNTRGRSCASSTFSRR